MCADMPKSNTARIAEVQRQRQKNSKKSEKYGSSTIYLQVLGSGARGAPNTLYLFTDQKRYMFNCGECTQRLAHEHKVKLSKLDHIFITSKTWKNLGGLPGLSLTLQDVGIPNITLHGPEGLDELYNATKRFVIMKDLNVTMAKCDPSEDFEDNVLSVKYVILGPQQHLLPSELKPVAKKPKLETPPDEHDQEFEEFIHDDTDYYTRETDKNKSKNRSKVNIDKDPLPKEKKRTDKVLHNSLKPNNYSVAYICTLKKRLGTLDLEKCVELGVKPGPMLGQLKNGHDVVLPNGTLVLSKDVKTPDDPGPVFIVLELPDIKWLKEDEFAAHFDNGSNPSENIPIVIVHYTPPHVFHHPTYQSFMSMFGPTTQHLILNGQNSCLGSEAVHKTQHMLHLLDPDIFPLLKDLSVPAVWNAHPPLPKTSSPVRLKGLEELKNKFQTIINMEGSGAEQGEGEPSPEAARLNWMAAKTLTMFHLRPKRELDRSAEPKLHIQDYIQETMDVDGFVPSLEQFRRLVDTMRYSKSDAREYPKVVFLGTGSCIPSKTRNTSGIVLQIDENRSMLLDCGEGTFNQLVRFYGPKRVNVFLRSLKAIYVSHLHADHHIGLIGVLQARKEALEEIQNDGTALPLYLLAPGQIVTWLAKYDQQFECIRNEFTLIPNQNLLESKLADPSNTDLTSAVLASMGVEKIVACQVAHCPNAFGIAVQVDGSHKVTYSGDTIPCDELAKIGINSTLLIHEATMEDELASEARTKMHSTTSQAIDMGRKMNARYTVLTHFSQRYARLPRLNAHILNDNKSVGIAFDNMQITMSDLDLLPHMYAPLQLMFAEHCVELELKAAHRARQKEIRKTSHGTIPTSGTSSKSLAHDSPSEEKARYRESHASRLRRESKFAALSDTSNSSRSKSCSPPRRVPPKLSNRSTSAPSKIPKRCVEKTKVDPKPVSGRDVNGRSKSLGCPGHSSTKTADVLLPEVKQDKTVRHDTSEDTIILSDGESSSGYGKPLVTPMNKRLMIKRNVRPVSSIVPGNKTTAKTVYRSRSPISSWKDISVSMWSITSLLIFFQAENRPTPKTSTPRDLSNISVLPNKTTASREKPRGSSGPNSRMEGRNIPIIAFNTAVRSPSPGLKTGSLPVKPINTSKYNKTPKRTRSYTCQNPNTINCPRITGTNSPNQKTPTGKDLQRLAVTRTMPNREKIKPAQVTNYSSKSFKPQLEDIKSSHLVLTMKNIDRNIKNSKPNNTIVTSIPKPQPLNEEHRKVLLLQTKNKFKSKQFWDDARYNKIEGLNWISWK
ncbi:unnamed protein product [Leptosia nina]|uniref:Zinc phosphodiesterase ELAC protein 2 n=1 Tax=Leptosia nina TaxID=320188 RepID=A0AAV1JCC8_9NEOP